MVELTFDILYLIVNVVGKLPHPYSYIIDTRTLRTLCLVSRVFNAIATPILYSSITISNQHSVSCLHATAKSNPKLLQWCHSINWSAVQQPPFVEDKLFKQMGCLRRLVTTRRSFDTYPGNVNTIELALLGISFRDLEYLTRHRYSFTNLQRLVVKHIWTHKDDAYENLIRMPRLTHLVVTSLGSIYLYLAEAGDFDGLAEPIKHVPRSCRVIFGLSTELFHTFDHDGFRRAIYSQSDCRDVQVFFLTYVSPNRCDKWLEERIANGTFWDMDLEKYRDPEHQIEVHC
jgi:hypothetical protein